MNLCVRWALLYREACFFFRIGKISLLRKDAREVKARRNKIRSKAKCSLDVADRSIQFSLLPQHPPERRLRLCISRRASDCLLKIGPRRSEVAPLKCLLPALVGERGDRSRRRRLRLSPAREL
jgi:hypothetical protein